MHIIDVLAIEINAKYLGKDNTQDGAESCLFHIDMHIYLVSRDDCLEGSDEGGRLHNCVHGV
jgi:hypothetical protein